MPGGESVLGLRSIRPRAPASAEGRTMDGADRKGLVIPAPEQVTIAVRGSEARFLVRRIYCVGRNYAAHVEEMGGRRIWWCPVCQPG